MASEFPHVQFVSLDFSPMAAHRPRENIVFEVYDLYSGLSEADASFDMVHVRHTANKVSRTQFITYTSCLIPVLHAEMIGWKLPVFGQGTISGAPTRWTAHIWRI
jgi:hypothetical protein